jgi:hypothetical protein
MRTATQTHTVMNLLAEVRRILGADELHVEAHGVSRETIATLFADGARPSHEADGLHAELDDAPRGVALDAIRPHDKPALPVGVSGAPTP